MIDKTQAMEILLSACPSFEESWRRHVEEYGVDLLYIAAGQFASHLLTLYQANAEESLLATGIAIERLHVEGSPWVKEFATIGVLEGVQNSWSHSSVDPSSFVQYLGPESRRWWQGLNKFWSSEAPNVRAEG